MNMQCLLICLRSSFQKLSKLATIRHKTQSTDEQMQAEQKEITRETERIMFVVAHGTTESEKKREREKKSEKRGN